MKLPLVEPFERDHAYCSYCPKLCRHSCPVSTAEARETTTPWGKMTSLHHVAHDALRMEESYASTWYACTGCMRCRTYCAHGNEVAAALGAGRSEAVAHHVAPKEATEIIEKHSARERKAAEAGMALFEGSTRPAAARSTVFFPGCTAVTRTPDDALAAFQVVKELAGGPVRVETSQCCGLPLLEAGDRAGFLHAMRSLSERVWDAERIVFGDPGCMHAMTVIAPSLGVRSVQQTDERPMEHVTQLAARNAHRFSRLPVPPSPVRYHDPCRLGRGLGIYEEPRQILQTILGKPAEEFFHNRERAECSGGGGQLPRTRPETATAIAADRWAQHDGAGGGLLVTACASSKTNFKKAGRTEVRDLSSLMLESLRIKG